VSRAGTYHHGNLRAALVDAALELVAEKGVAGLSVAEAARRTGVSTGAPYRHFASRAALLSAAATVAGRQLLARTGRFGPYVTEVLPEDDKGKPKTASLFKSMSLDTVTLEEAEQPLGDGLRGTRHHRGPRPGPFVHPDADVVGAGDLGGVAVLAVVTAFLVVAL
jgi:AcrR family transcriptional regulator